MLTTQDANSIVIWKSHPKVQSNILNTTQLFESTNVNIICGAFWKILGITVLYFTVGGTGPELIVPIKVLLLP
jgi:uncharacterized membrane protein